MSRDETAFAEFFEDSWDPCLRAVAASTGNLLLAEEQVAEAFARAWVSWRKLRRHPAPRAWVVRTALNTGASAWRTNGTDTLALNPQELLDAAALQRSLAEYDIPATVTTGSFCSSDPAPAGFSRVVSVRPSGPQTVRAEAVEQPTITFHPEAMPAGTKLSFGSFQLANGQQQANAALIHTGAYTCTSVAPRLGPGSDSLGLLYGGPHRP